MKKDLAKDTFLEMSLFSVGHQHTMEIKTRMPYIMEVAKTEMQHGLTTWLLFDSTFSFILRKWQPTPAFLLGESHGQRSLAGYSLWGRKSRTRMSG